MLSATGSPARQGATTIHESSATRSTAHGRGSAQELRALRDITASYQFPVLHRSIWQLANTFLPFVAICALMYASLSGPYWLTLVLALPAAGLVVRIFIIQHDCGHGSFFRGRWPNEILGAVCSLITLTPYAAWRRQHAGHHGNWNNLDRRLSGADFYSSCLTVPEYEALPWRARLGYRVLRNPVVSLLLIPPLVFIVLYRLPFDTPKSWRAERRSVHVTNAMLLAVVLVLGSLVGFHDVLLVQLPVLTIAAIIGVWLFSVQHRYERVLWARQEAWTFVDASLAGSSFLKLPKVLQWFTGNIGYHHVHHLNPRVPNYRLEECCVAAPALRQVPVLTLWNALTSWRYGLWDEHAGRLVPFGSNGHRD